MALVPFISTRSDLLDQIKIRLGYPVVNIEVTDDQIEIAINGAVEKFVEFGTGGIQYRFRTIDTSTEGNEFQMDQDVYAIIQVYGTQTPAIEVPFPDKLLADSVGSLQTGDLVTLQLTREYLQTLEHLLVQKVAFEYNPATKVLYFPEGVGDTAGICYYQIPDYSDETLLLYDHNWIKNYAYALTMYQWGTNLTKFEGSVLPSGLTINATRYFDEAKDLIDKLDTELEEVWQIPVNFFVG